MSYFMIEAVLFYIIPQCCVSITLHCLSSTSNGLQSTMPHAFYCDRNT